MVRIAVEFIMTMSTVRYTGYWLAVSDDLVKKPRPENLCLLPTEYLLGFVSSFIVSMCLTADRGSRLFVQSNCHAVAAKICSRTFGRLTQWSSPQQSLHHYIK